MYLDLEHCNFDLAEGPGSPAEGTWSGLLHDPSIPGYAVVLLIQGRQALIPVATEAHGRAVIGALRSHGALAEAPEPERNDPCEDAG